MSPPAIAIVGRGCVLPGAFSPAELWDLVLHRRSAITDADASLWRADPAAMLTVPDQPEPDKTWSLAGGHVRGFDTVFDPTGFRLRPEEISPTDTPLRWLLHCGRQALQEAGLAPDGALPRAGLIVGNLSYPPDGHAAFAESVWLQRGKPPSPRDRFSSGLPAILTARGLGCTLGGLALDAACASSLYAIKLACDRLGDGRADLMIAGAINAVDPLFLNMGFAALGALSRTGRSLPFHRAADGIVPAWGAVLVALRRLEDALAEGQPVLGVIRAVGLSNDGAGGTLLVPDPDGQARAMMSAYRQAQIDPTEISLVECHGTGTPVGDQAELASMRRVFGRSAGLTIGSIKGNLGHPMTAAGGAGLLKVLGAFERALKPPTLGAEDPTPELTASPFRLLANAEPWECSGPRRAAVSAFGFGGNNAHLIVEEGSTALAAPSSKLQAPGWDPGCPSSRETSRLNLEPGAWSLELRAQRASSAATLAIVGMGVRAAGGSGSDAFIRHLFLDAPVPVALPDGGYGFPAGPLVMPLDELRMPPAEAAETLGQQLLLQAAAGEAMTGITLSPERAAVFIGMGCDPQVARHGSRWRVADALHDVPPETHDALAPPVTAGHIKGSLPNVVANRLSRRFDLRAPSCTVSAEEGSGLAALALARDALAAGEIDTALVGAVDLSCERTHRAAAEALLPANRRVAGDAAVVLVVKRFEDALATGQPILALLPCGIESSPSLELVLDGEESGLTTRLGHAHAASGLLMVAAAAAACAHALQPAGSRSTSGSGADVGRPTPGSAPARGARTHSAAEEPGTAWTEPAERRQAVVRITALGGQQYTEHVCAVPGVPARPVPAFAVHAYPKSRPTVTLETRMPEPQFPLMPEAQAPTLEVAATGPGDFAKMLPAPELPTIETPWMRPLPVPHPPTSNASRLTTHSEQPASPRPPKERLIQVHARVQQAWLEQMTEAQTAFLETMARRGKRQIGTRPHPPAPSPNTGRGGASKVPGSFPPLPAGYPRGKRVGGGEGGQGGEGGLLRTQPQLSVPNDRRPDPRNGLTRTELEVLASGKVSTVLGPLFEPLDSAAVQVRLPMPPLLMVDRVTEIDAEPAILGTGTMRTETDVVAGAWYLHQGRMPAGLMIEAGQADLLLISWMGIDFHLCDSRVYRLLGLELTYHGPLAQPGETLCYEIYIDSHTQLGETRLFSFGYDCRVNGELRMTARNAQAGFFTPEELTGSQGVLWDAATAPFDRAARLDPPRVPACKSSLTRSELDQFAAGDAFGCFGTGFEAAACHHRTPAIPGGALLLLDRVTHLEPRGGPWGRGYLRAEKELRPDDWFFPPHFKGDPCMPGTLMFDGCVQALSVYLTALGFTLDRDGWRFEPVPEQTMVMRCRGQAVPDSQRLVYELFVASVTDGETPTVTADLLCTVDGVKSFHCRDLSLRLVPDQPLNTLIRRLAPEETRVSEARTDLGVRGDYGSLLALAWGRLSTAFGPEYARLDDSGTVLRLPGPPYLCMSRITAMPPKPGTMETGVSVEAELDIDPAAWYFADHGARVMPHCLLLEAAVQPCGWLATFMGCPLVSSETTRFRALDGKSWVLGEVQPDAGPLTTRVTVTHLSRLEDIFLIGCEAECRQGERAVYRLETLVGFFPPPALANRADLPPDKAAAELISLPCAETIDLRTHPDAFFGGPCRLAEGNLLMIDRITGLWPTGGRKGLGALRAETAVDPRAWYFKAHFFQDPVQPGSLGLEAMLQLVQVSMLHAGMHHGLRQPRFQVINGGGPMEWKYRGQVLPTDRRFTVTAEIVETGTDEQGPYVIADASLWVDGRRIQEARGIGVRIVSDVSAERESRPALLSATPETNRVREFTFDPEEHAWVKDHCPTFVLPTLPLMGMADMLAEAAAACRPGWVVTELCDVQAYSWLLCDRPRRLRVEVAEAAMSTSEEKAEGLGASLPSLQGERATFKVRLLAVDGKESRGERIAEGIVILAEEWPASPPPLPPAEGETQPDPYRAGRMFHGPAFQYLRALRMGPGGSSAVLAPSAGSVERGILSPGLLDAATHGIPGESLHQWSPALDPGVVAYPRRLQRARFYGPAPGTSLVRSEARLAELLPGPRPIISVDVIDGQRRWVSLQLEFICLPKGPLGSVDPVQRAAFLRDRQFVPEAALSRRQGKATVLDRSVVRFSDWLPGTVAAVYAADPASDLCRQVAVKEHVARAWRRHPSAVSWREDSKVALLDSGRHPVRVREEGKCVVVEDDTESEPCPRPK